ncbi:helix-turn-helix domain-containing protein [Alloacidobacterium dinghuense]|uniref:Helix-turn-helix domain-containing protein n=1 Tax=Alloacidobacterium dinghuense TaxID=2763107 RepID=A0A7G8BHR6_9BACT|nr:helix-turn-helix domain-containing protein [Alloacidobacterium dinghuense]
MPLPHTEQLHAIEAAADRLQIASKTIRNWIGARRIAVYRIGRSVRIPESEIQRILNEGYGPALDEDRAI